MKFRFYITDLFNGCVKGTNDESVAKQFIICEDYFVVDSVNGVWLIEDEKVDVSNIDAE